MHLPTRTAYDFCISAAYSDIAKTKMKTALKKNTRQLKTTGKVRSSQKKIERLCTNHADGARKFSVARKKGGHFLPRDLRWTSSIENQKKKFNWNENKFDSWASQQKTYPARWYARHKKFSVDMGLDEKEIRKSTAGSREETKRRQPVQPVGAGWMRRLGSAFRRLPRVRRQLLLTTNLTDIVTTSNSKQHCQIFTNPRVSTTHSSTTLHLLILIKKIFGTTSVFIRKWKRFIEWSLFSNTPSAIRTHSKANFAKLKANGNLCWGNPLCFSCTGKYTLAKQQGGVELWMNWEPTSFTHCTVESLVEVLGLVLGYIANNVRSNGVIDNALKVHGRPKKFNMDQLWHSLLHKTSLALGRSRSP